MIKPEILILLAVLVGAAGYPSDGFPQILCKAFELKVYGEKETGTIEVRVLGSGVERPGRYFVSEKTSALEAVQKAGISEPRFSVIRSRESTQKREEYRFSFDTRSEDGVKKAKEFMLEAGDVVFAAQPII